MKAVALSKHGGPEVLQRQDFPDPSPRQTEVLVRIRACALNHLDIWVRKGLPNLCLHYPHILGSDIAGTVEALGEEVRLPLKKGDRVLVHPATSCGTCQACLSGRDNLCREYKILGEQISGGYTQLIAVRQEKILPYPSRLTFEEASAIPLVFLTAWQMVMRKAALKTGETILIHAAGSGVGTAAIQIAKLVNARVLVTASKDEKLEKAKRLGADEGVNYASEDFSAAVKKITHPHGVDVIIDHTGTENWEKNLKILKPDGRLVLCGATSGPSASTDLARVFFRQLNIMGSTMGRQSDLLELLPLFDKGLLQPVVDRVFSLEDAQEAHRYLESRNSFGKVILTIP